MEDPQEGGLRRPWIKNITFDVRLKASELINPVARRWNETALQQIFVPGDVELIMQRQPVVSQEDFHSWRFNKNGNFSVKSAYWLACSLKTQSLQPEAIRRPSLNPLKELTWKVKTLPKIKIFLWKSLNDALPVADLLLRRGMKADDRCQLCGREGEDINHVLFVCDIARQVWALAGIPSPKEGFNDISIFENFNYLFGVSKLRTGTVENKRAWPWIVWNLWKSRNEFLFQGQRGFAEEIVLKARKESEEWFLAQVVERVMEEEEAQEDISSKLKWTPPPKDWLMCNIALDWNKSTRSLGVAWVVRNHRGVVLCHSRRAFAEIKSLDEAKMETLLWAVASMESLRFNKIIMAGDFEVLFGAIMRPLAWPAFRFQREEIVRVLSGIRDWKLLRTKKEENRGASFIAESVNSQGLVQSCVASGHPSWLFEFFVNESRHL